MTVTFLDGSTLSSTTETIDFTTDRLVTSISVEFNPGASTGFRETVFDGTSDVDNTGGDFSNLYRASTRSGSGPYTWAIRRQGRWPADFRIRVKEMDAPVVPPPIPTSGQPLGTIYEVDFTTLANQNMATAGSYVVDGKTWWAKGTDATGGGPAIVNGSGMRQTYGIHDPSSVNQYKVMFMPLAQFSDYNHLAPVVAQFRFGAGNFASWTAYGGLAQMAADANARTIGGRQDACVGVGAGTTTSMRYIAGNETTSSYGGLTWTNPPTDIVFSVYRFSNSMVFFGAVSSPGVWPDPFTISTPKSGGQPLMRDVGVWTSPGFTYFVNNLSGTFYLTNLRLLQPRIP